MSKKSLVVVAVFVAGLFGGATAARAFTKPAAPAAPCAVDMCWDAKGHCVVCPE